MSRRIPEAQARKLLADLLAGYSAGSVLHLLAEVLREAAGDEADDAARENLRHAEAALIVFGVGLDAYCPR